MRHWRGPRQTKADVRYVDSKVQEINTALESKAEKQVVEATLNKKADKASVEAELKNKITSDYMVKYVDSKVKETNTALQTKADKQVVEATLNKKADKASVEAELNNKITAVYVDEALEGKANTQYVNSKIQQVDTLLSSKADLKYVDDELGKRAHKDAMTKVLKIYVDDELQNYAKKIPTEAELKRLDDIKADKTTLAADKTAMQAALDQRAAAVDAAMKERADKVDAAMKERADKVDAAMKDRAAKVDAELAKKTGKDFLEAQLAGLSDTARKAHREIEVALKEEIDFEASKSTLSKNSAPIIKKVANVLKKHPTLNLCVEGHTGCKCHREEHHLPDTGVGASPARSPARKRLSTGKAKDGCKAVELSNSRAASVIEALRQAGCDNQMFPAGHGCYFRVGMAVKIFPQAGQ
eukprot:TRINITY_DN6451_c0_g1_i12.p1 TRINITY_DN6451_c0_g1~~TRINITY_DN6451_c0_g1_i12.p1  ORF type:complete len:413 (+),score=111.68 TRINITY_DN6451_c0_g1_i12:209-1447(+)